MLTIESGAAALFERACREPLVERHERERGPALDEAAIRALLPHRRPFVFLDRVTRLDSAKGVIVGRYDVQQDSSLLAGLPQRPVWRGLEGAGA
jgi:3-hydroxyacyl-[acyl-carrier-protein] dehydratase